MSSVYVGHNLSQVESADTAAWLYDNLVADEPSRALLEEWSSGGTAIERQVAELVLSARLTHAHVESLARTARGGFHVLRGIDRAFVVLDRLKAGARDRRALAGLWQRWHTFGRLDTGVHGGVVLPRRCLPGRPLGVPDDLDGYLSNLVRVPEAALHGRHGRKAELLRCPALDDLDATDRGELSLGAVAFIGDLGELRLRRLTGKAGHDWYSITLGDGLVWRDRAERVLHALDQADVQVGLMPEMALDTNLLEQWQELVRTTPRPAESRLSWVLLGTGPVGGSDSSAPPNRAVMINRVTGNVVLSQDKRHPFTLATSHLDKWGLRSQLGEGPLAEWMTEGRAHQILESTVGRFGVLVCDDLGRVVEAAPEVAAFGLTHLFVPIFAEPIRRFRWEERSADILANQVGCGTAVVNSCAVQPASVETEVGTALFLHAREQWGSEDWGTVTTLMDAQGDPERVLAYAVPTS